MNEPVESRGKLDIISSLQMSNAQNSSQKKEEEEEDRWSDYDEEEEEIEHGKGARVVAKVENKEKAYTGLRDYLGNEVQKPGKYYNKGQQGERGNRPNQKRKDYNNPYYNKPVYTNSSKLEFNEEDSSKIMNTNSDYMQKKPGGYAYNTNLIKGDRRGYNKGYGTYDRNQKDKFSNKTFTGVSQLLRNTYEENAKIKAPLRPYNESSLMQANQNEYPGMMNTNSQYRPKQGSQEKQVSEFQKPVFVNSNLESKSNFKELDTEKDSAAADHKPDYTEKDSKDNKNPAEVYPDDNEENSTNIKSNPIQVSTVDEKDLEQKKPESEGEIDELETNTKPIEVEEVGTEKETASYQNNQYYRGGNSGYSRGGRYRKFNTGYMRSYDQEADLWKAIGGNKKPDYDNYNTYTTSYNNYNYDQDQAYSTPNNQTGPQQSDPKPKKIIRREEKPKVTDKVEVHLRNAKNLTELLK